MTVPDHPATTPADTLEGQLAAERAHLTESRAALARMRERAAEISDVAGNAWSSEALGKLRTRRLKELADDPNTPLFFGRLDHVDGQYTGERFHIGRRHVADDTGEPMVIDWRAPVSTSFYRASVADPRGVGLRRRFGYSGGDLTSFEDEHLLAGEELGTTSRILTEEIERPRVGPMRDIVATIQPEQDELVRADLDSSLCVQGAPGTGKTAVGLHRAAYLLYTHRERLKRAGVLVIGPNRAFLSYIAAVLPALGEVEVDQLTMDELVAHVPVRATDPIEAARVKHDARMAEVLARALEAHIRKPEESLMVPDGGWRWRLSAEALRRMVDDVRREGLPYGSGRDRVRARVVAALQRQCEARGDSPGEPWLRRIGRSRPVKEFLDQCWPAVEPAGLVAHLFSDRAALAAAADGLLDESEQDAIDWTANGGRPRGAKATRWTEADRVLIDEAAGLIERVGSYGHVVVDEAQDLSPMQCRAVARRNLHGSLTVLGDLAQGTAAWATRHWPATLAHLGKPDTPVVALTTGFRVPDTVLRLANRLLPSLDVDVPAATSLRHDGSLEVRRVRSVAPALVDAVREALTTEGSVAVIAPDASIATLGKALTAAGLSSADPDDVESTERVRLVPATLAKGLEFDHVIVVEPAEIVAAEPRGLHRLYVVLTRAVSRLVVLHSDDLPPALAA